MRFHAAPPAGYWFNDPVALIDGAASYLLFVQCRDDAPAFNRCGWARLSSPDLVEWTFDGTVIGPTGAGSAYSGSVTETDVGLEAWFTRHDDGKSPRERQHRASSMDNGLTWADEQCTSLPGGYDVRDPFVFDDPGGSGRYALLAKPCRWEDWQRSARSAIEVWRLVADKGEPCGDVHLAFSPGVVAEMPRLLWLGGRCFLVVSTVDRRDANRSSVMIYPGRFTDGTFYPSDENGRLLDAGPDYYAAISGNGRLANMIVAWAGSWRTARGLQLPSGGTGGAITIPRRAVLTKSGELALEMPARFSRGARVVGSEHKRIILSTDSAVLEVEVDDGRMRATRTAADPRFDWQGDHVLLPRSFDSWSVLLDGPLVELYVGGSCVTAFLPGSEITVAAAA